MRARSIQGRAPVEGAHAASFFKTTARLELPGGGHIEVCDDRYSDRLRCDHPRAIEDGQALGERLLEEARRRERGRVVALAPQRLGDGLARAGLELEGRMPGFYRGQEDCAVMGATLAPGRAELAHPIEDGRVDEILAQPRPARPVPDLDTRLAEPEDAEAIAALLGRIFADYPTPSDDPAYVAAEIERGAPYRLIERGGQIVACASADTLPEARTAELTDCATRPSHRGQGLMRAILGELMEDLRARAYPTCFTLARARVPGVNIVFQRLGFLYRGRMVQSCRIGQGIEDMNIWSRAL